MSASKSGAALSLRQSLDALAPWLAERSVQVDAEGNFPSENMAALHRSGLLQVGLSLQRGGAGLGRETPFADYFELVTGLARACSNTAQLFTVQNGALYTLEQLASEALLDEIASAVQRQGASFCFVGAEPDERFTHDNKRVNIKSVATPLPDGQWHITAEKAFATGSVGCQYALFQCATVTEDDGRPPESVLVVLPRHHSAVTIQDTWNGVGQRATASGRLHVAPSQVSAHWVVGNPASAPHGALFAPLYQLGFAAILAGIGEAALDDTLKFVHGTLKPTHGYQRPADEPAIQAHVGDIRIALSASRALIREAARSMDAYLRQETEIADVLVAVYQAKVHASASSLEAGSRLFQVGGARSATRDWAFDRHWRNARTLTLHDSVDKQKGIVARHILGIERPNVSTR
ncbi:acyl-CoA dehydrogenase family protein [Bordetella genomosp. 12]|uniref:Uncharacterized protein n=1 Tax=Bordetella genomosp. 12 TaxID=463035 RepID=A0A261VDX3_9BORD|nr:acyl-CoA dehydrogenase family protein [Bordetella genomosp. 12]OZI71961.1 hypothetical protein CAL22_19470 [Bordetella genomosp. 12]